MQRARLNVACLHLAHPGLQGGRRGRQHGGVNITPCIDDQPCWNIDLARSGTYEGKWARRASPPCPKSVASALQTGEGGEKALLQALPRPLLPRLPAQQAVGPQLLLEVRQWRRLGAASPRQCQLLVVLRPHQTICGCVAEASCAQEWRQATQVDVKANTTWDRDGAGLLPPPVGRREGGSRGASSSCITRLGAVPDNFLKLMAAAQRVLGGPSG